MDQRCTSYDEACWTSATHWHPQPNVPPATVLEVTIKGKLAAAYGPTFQEMRRAGPPQELEREIGNPIRWGPNLAKLPHEIVILGIVERLSPTSATSNVYRAESNRRSPKNARHLSPERHHRRRSKALLFSSHEGRSNK